MGEVAQRDRHNAHTRKVGEVSSGSDSAERLANLWAKWHLRRTDYDVFILLRRTDKAVGAQLSAPPRPATLILNLLTHSHSGTKLVLKSH